MVVNGEAVELFQVQMPMTITLYEELTVLEKKILIKQNLFQVS